MKFIINLLAVAVALAIASPASAAILSVTGPVSTVGASAAIIGNPTNALDDMVTNKGMQGFDEKQNVLLLAMLGIDTGFIAAGNRVDSHMLFLNSFGKTLIIHKDVEWTFSGAILGVMSDKPGLLEAASTPILGASGTNYAVFANRGFEGIDTYSILGNVLKVTMKVTEPGDWIRVVTVSAIPIPAALPLFGTGLGILGFLGWRRRRKAVAAA